MSPPVSSPRGFVAEPVRFVREQGRVIALNQQRPAWAVLNESAAWLLSECVPGTQTAETLLPEYRRRFGYGSRDDLQRGLESLAAAGLLTSDTGPGTGPANDPPPLEAYQVEHLYVELSARCNLRCRHCYMEGSPERIEHLKPEEVTGVLGEFAQLGGRFVTLSGGEPLIYPHFTEMAEVVEQLGLRGTVITNGVPLRERHVTALRELGFTIAISIDGASQDVNDRIRGPRTFPKILRALELALRAMGPDRVILSFSPSRMNLDEIPELFTLAHQLGVRRLNLSLLEVVGRAAQYAGDLAMTGADRVRAIDLIYREALQYLGEIEVDFNDTRNILELFDGSALAGRAHPLWRGVRLDSSGEVFPSTFGSVPDFRLGNIRENRLDEIFASDTLADLYQTLLNRSAKIPRCHACEWRQICDGGGVTAAYYANRNMFSLDPYCEGYLATYPKVALALSGTGPSR